MTDLDELFEAFAVTDSITIDAPQRRVWDVVSDFRLMAEGEPDAARAHIDERAEMLRSGMRRTLEALRDTLEGS